jgi:hypothetical protein
MNCRASDRKSGNAGRTHAGNEDNAITGLMFAILINVIGNRQDRELKRRGRS